ncbi:MAG: PD40 domain-containing protein [Acidimicrobiia bacterium]|nr:PD40 domain-containing protein [Acidimicrobiia bacterium]
MLATTAVPTAMVSSVAVGAPAQRDGLIAFSVGYQLPPNDDDLAIPSDIWTVRPDGTGRRRLTHVPEGRTAAMPSWSPSGGSLVYQSNVAGTYGLWRINAGGEGNVALLSEPGYDDLTPSWSPDGRTIAFSRCDRRVGFITSCALALVDADGSNLRVVLDGKRLHLRPIFSPDGRSIAFQSDRAGLLSAIWLIGRDGHGLRRLTSAATEASWPDFTPDGRRVVYSTHCCLPHSDLESVPVTGGPATPLTHASGLQNDAFGSVSPSGRSLLFSSDERHPGCCTNDLVVQGPDGRQHRVVDAASDVVFADWGSAPLGSRAGDGAELPATSERARSIAAAPVAPTAAAAQGGDPAPSAGGGRLLYTDASVGQVFAADPVSGRRVQLTHVDRNHAATEPDTSPDGRSIVFSVVAFDDAPSRTWIMNADGSGAHPLAADPDGLNQLTPVFTPDGRRIVYARCGEVCAIWSMDRTGRARRPITPFRSSPTEEAVDFAPSVSPDGTQVAFSRYNWRGIAVQVWVADIGGGHERPLTPASLEGAQPAWSPQSGRLAFTAGIIHFGSTIWMVDRDGTSLQRRTSTPYPHNDFVPTWSPDGTRIGFESDRRYGDFCCVDAFSMRTDGTSQRRVPVNSSVVSGLDWGTAPPPGRAELSASAATALAPSAQTSPRTSHIADQPGSRPHRCDLGRRAGPTAATRRASWTASCLDSAFRLNGR